MGVIKRNTVPTLDKQVNKASERDERSSNKEATLQTEVDIGLDISTAVVGICILEHKTGVLVKLQSLKLNTVGLDTMWKKANEFRSAIPQMIVGLTPKRIFVEANAKMFSKGFSSADTLFTLAKFNGICSYIAQDLMSVPIIDVSVVSARSKLGLKIDRTNKTKTTKEKVREQVLVLYPAIPIKTHIAKTGKSKGKQVPDKETEDEIDAFVIVSGGRILNPC